MKTIKSATYDPQDQTAKFKKEQDCHIIKLKYVLFTKGTWPKSSRYRKKKTGEQEQKKKQNKTLCFSILERCIDHPPKTPSSLSSKKRGLLLRVTNRDGSARNSQRGSRDLPGHGDLSKDRSHLWLSRQPINYFLGFLLDLSHLAVNWKANFLNAFPLSVVVVVAVPVLHLLVVDSQRLCFQLYLSYFLFLA